MLSYSWYLLKVIICSGILFGYYWFFLRNKIFHQYNRFYLLSAMLLSLLLPVLKINFWQPTASQNTAISVLQAVSTGDEYMSSMVIVADNDSWSMEQFYTWAYLFVSLLFLFVLIRTLYRIMLLLKKYPVQEIEQVSFVNTEDASTPFSFFRYIFWNNNIDINTSTGRQIFKHEVAHVQEKHTYDKLFVNISLIFCWCNPFFWLYRKELNMIHEFIADRKAVEDSDTSAFAAMILQAAYPKQQFNLTNNFFYSPIKRRLIMLTKIDNPKLSYVARLMVLPLAILVFAAFTFKARSINESLSKVQAIKQVVENINSPTASSTLIEEKYSSMNKDTVPDKELMDLEKVLLIVNGKIIGRGKKAVEELNNIQTEFVEVKWLKRKEAMAKYGADGAEGACESNFKEGTVFTTTYVDADKKSIFYIGMENPLKVSVANVKPEDLLVKISEGSISGTNGKYVVRVTHPGEVKFTLSKKDGTELPFSYTVKAKRLPDPDDPDFPPGLKVNVPIEPRIFLGKFRGGRISIDDLKAQKEIRVTQGYSFVSADIWFSYPNPKSVTRVQTLSSSTSSISEAIENCVDGSTIMFDKVYVKDDLGNRKLVMTPPGFSVFDSKQMKAIDTPIPDAITQSNQDVKLDRDNVNNIIFTKTEVEPQFTGGDEAWKKYLGNNIKTAIPVGEGWTAGKHTVFVKFIVHADGTVSGITTENYQGTKTAQHCIDVIKNAPKWQPAVQNGIKVNAYKKQPITFVIGE